MNKDYLKYLFNSKKTAVTFISISYLILYLATYVSSYVLTGSDHRQMSALAVVMVIAYILSMALVPVMFGYVHSKKAVDTYFCLPVSRKQQIITTQAFLDAIVIVPVTILAFVSMFISILNGYTNVLAFILLILAFIASIIALVAFNTSTYLQAYSSFDGIVMMAAYLLIPVLVLLIVDNFVDSYIYGFNSIDMEPFMSVTSIVYASFCLLTNLASSTNRNFLELTYPILNIICFVWHFVISIYVLKKDYINRSVEKAENVSDKITAYPFLIKLFTFSILATNASLLFKNATEEFIIFFALIFVFYEIANCVYRRKIKIYIKDVLLFIIATALAILIGFVSFKTEGFGISREYEKNPKNVTYFFHQYEYYDKEYDDALHKLVLEKYPEAYSVSMSANIQIPSSKMNESKQIIDYFENMRSDLITDYYSRGFIDTNSIYYGGLTVYNNRKENSFGIASEMYGEDVIQYNYQRCSYIDFSLDELMLMNEYGDVIISFGTINEWYDLSLDELLKE